ncbi:unnamed protein product [Tilletia laevis]|uniref:Uncharacterized protein n=2 Tax=Tilletia TaxID=13289 RepID=A0A8X7MV87_9BASI|nr:hypothetical protein CF336_g3272 [Tilletia laevis]KAE8195700.1 hypothetical protein CF328_g4352 [Tilletia controversa]KAE8259335.1 hypothetical protein A4X03_0g4121 [Tilletia caries]KAE8200364.1 hypothetical protein CF335_g3975 [Tilletia laevis]KAE8248482.1 hypothetical protein A4X06_0g3680 [Tilletia controversa]
MKLCNPATILLLALLSTLFVEAFPATTPLHSPSIEGDVDKLHDRAGIKGALSDLASKRHLLVTNTEDRLIIAGTGALVAASAVYMAYYIAQHCPGGSRSDASPTNGRQSAADATAGTHRDLVQREEMDRICAANVITLKLEEYLRSV